MGTEHDPEKLVAEAYHKSVNLQRLTELKPNPASRYLYDEPLINYVIPEEQPHFIFAHRSQTVELKGPGAPTAPKHQGGGMVMHMITNRRWLTVAANQDKDQKIDVFLNSINGVTVNKSGVGSHDIAVSAGDFAMKALIGNMYSGDAIEAVYEWLVENTAADGSGLKELSNSSKQSEENLAEPFPAKQNENTNADANKSSSEQAVPNRRRPPVTAVRVQNFRNILDSGKVPLNQITTLIGKNEAGKTSFLDAIERFHGTNGYCDLDLCDFRDEETGPNPPVLTIYFESNDIDNDLYNPSYREKSGHKQSGQFKITVYADGSRELVADENIKRIYDEYKSAIDDAVKEAKAAQFEIIQLLSDESKNLKPAVGQALSNIVNEPRKGLDPKYVDRLENGIDTFVSQFELSSGENDKFEAYAERLSNLKRQICGIFSPALPEITRYPDENMVSDRATIEEIKAGNNPIFSKLLSIGDISPEMLSNMSWRDRDDLLDELCSDITKNMNEFWQQKTVNISIGVDDEELALYVRDYTTSPGSQSKRKPPSERSDGFRWFLTFCISIVSDSQTTSDRNRLSLFDEPALNLHPKGKHDWLSTIEKLSHKIQIIYTSHSPYLINKSHPSRIRTIEPCGENQEAVVSTHVFGSEDDTFEPLRNSLGIGLGHSPFVSKRQIIVEGPSDYYILAGVAIYNREVLDRDILDWGGVSITPAGGATKIPEKAVWFASEDIEYAMLLDSDEEGKKVRDEIKNKYHTLEDGLMRTTMLKTSKNSNDVTIEDMIDPELYVECFNEVYKERYDGFDPVDAIPKPNGDYQISGKNHDGTLIVDLLEALVEEQGIDEDELSKAEIADKIKQRIDRNEIHKDQISDFEDVFSDLRAATELRD